MPTALEMIEQAAAANRAARGEDLPDQRDNILLKPMKTRDGKYTVLDADTVIINETGERIRVDGIDAYETQHGDELGERGGIRQKAAMLEQLNRGDVAFQREGKGHYGRTLASVSAGGEDVATNLVTGAGVAPSNYGDGLHLRQAAFDQGVHVSEASTNADIAEGTNAYLADVSQREDWRSGGTFNRSVHRGVDQAQSSLYGFANAMGEATGVDLVAEWGEEGYQRNLHEAAKNPATIQSWDDVDSWATFGTFFVESLGEQAPQLMGDAAMALTGAGVGAVAGRRLAMAKIGKSVAQKFGTEKAEAFLTSKAGKAMLARATAQGAKRGAQGAAFGSMYAQSAGETQMALKDEGIDSAATALLMGFPKAGLEYASTVGILGRAKEALGVKPETFGALVKSVAGNIGFGTATEGATEGLQTIADYVAVNLHNGSEIFSDENLKELRTAIAKGAVVGGSMSGVGSLGTGAQYAAKRAEMGLASPEDSTAVGTVAGTNAIPPSNRPKEMGADVDDTDVVEMDDGLRPEGAPFDWKRNTKNGFLARFGPNPGDGSRTMNFDMYKKFVAQRAEEQLRVAEQQERLKQVVAEGVTAVNHDEIVTDVEPMTDLRAQYQAVLAGRKPSIFIEQGTLDAEATEKTIAHAEQNGLSVVRGDGDSLMISREPAVADAYENSGMSDKGRQEALGYVQSKDELVDPESAVAVQTVNSEGAVVHGPEAVDQDRAPEAQAKHEAAASNDEQVQVLTLKEAMDRRRALVEEQGQEARVIDLVGARLDVAEHNLGLSGPEPELNSGQSGLIATAKAAIGVADTKRVTQPQGKSRTIPADGVANAPYASKTREIPAGVDADGNPTPAAISHEIDFNRRMINVLEGRPGGSTGVSSAHGNVERSEDGVVSEPDAAPPGTENTTGPVGSERVVRPGERTPGRGGRRRAKRFLSRVRHLAPGGFSEHKVLEVLQQLEAEGDPLANEIVQEALDTYHTLLQQGNDSQSLGHIASNLLIEVANYVKGDTQAFQSEQEVENYDPSYQVFEPNDDPLLNPDFDEGIDTKRIGKPVTEGRVKALIHAVENGYPTYKGTPVQVDEATTRAGTKALYYPEYKKRQWKNIAQARNKAKALSKQYGSDFTVYRNPDTKMFELIHNRPPVAAMDQEKNDDLIFWRGIAKAMDNARSIQNALTKNPESDQKHKLLWFQATHDPVTGYKWMNNQQYLPMSAVALTEMGRDLVDDTTEMTLPDQYLTQFTRALELILSRRNVNGAPMLQLVPGNNGIAFDNVWFTPTADKYTFQDLLWEREEAQDDLDALKKLEAKVQRSRGEAQDTLKNELAKSKKDYANRTKRVLKDGFFDPGAMHQVAKVDGVEHYIRDPDKELAHNPLEGLNAQGNASVKKPHELLNEPSTHVRVGSTTNVSDLLVDLASAALESMKLANTHHFHQFSGKRLREDKYRDRAVQVLQKAGVEQPLDVLRQIATGKAGWSLPVGDDVHVFINEDRPSHDRVAVLAHELGHSAYAQVLNDIQRSLAKGPVKSQRWAKVHEQFLKEQATVKDQPDHQWNKDEGFQEWFADKYAAWVLNKAWKDAEPTNPLERAFHLIRKQIKKLIQAFKKKGNAQLRQRITTNPVFNETWESLLRETAANNFVKLEASAGHALSLGPANRMVAAAMTTMRQTQFVRTATKLGKGIANLGTPLLTADHQLRKMGAANLADAFHHQSNSAVHRWKARVGEHHAWLAGKTWHQQRWNRRVHDLQEKHGDALADALRAIAGYDPSVPVDWASKPQAVRDVRAMLDEFYDYLKPRLPTLGHLENFSPTYYNQEEIASRKDAFMDILLSKGAVLDRDSASAAADTIIRDGVDASLAFEDKVNGPASRHARQRLLEAPGLRQALLNEGFYLDPSPEALDAYFSAGIKKAEFENLFSEYTVLEEPGTINHADPQSWLRSRVSALVDGFGVDLGYRDARRESSDWREVTPILERLESMGWMRRDPQTDEWSWYFSQKKLDDALPRTPHQRARAEQLVKGMMGQLGHDVDPQLRNAAGWVIVAENYLTLLFSAVASLPDFAGTLMRTREFKAAYNGLKTQTKALAEFGAYRRMGPEGLSRDQQNRWERARILGLIGQRVTHQAINDYFGQSFYNEQQAKASAFLFKANGQEMLTNASRVASLAVGEEFLLDHAYRAREGDERSIRYLEGLNVKVADIMAWEGDGKRLGLDRHGAVEAALNRFVNESIVRPDAASRPLWASSGEPHYMLLWHLKSFFYAFGQQIVGGMVREIKARRDAGDTRFQQATPALIAGMTLMPLAALALEIRHSIQYDDEEDEPSERQDTPDYLWDVFRRTGMLGPAELAFGVTRHGNSDSVATGMAGPAFQHLHTLITGDVEQKIKRSLPVFNQVPQLWDAVSK